MKKKGFDENEKGRIINNLPKENCGVQTGSYQIDHYGCWYEVKRKNGTKFWMIGEYPNKFYEEGIEE